MAYLDETGLARFWANCKSQFATADDLRTYGLSISGHTVSLVEGGTTASVTVPDSDTTYDAMSVSEASTGTATNARTISASVLKSAIEGKVDDDTIKVNSSGKLYVAIPNLDTVSF